MNLYDVGSSDMGDLWDNPLLLESGLCHDTLLVCSGKEDDWGMVQDMPSSLRTDVDSVCSTNVVLRDRLMTDAALGGPKPIKTEHSYSLLACGPPSPARDPSLTSYSGTCDATSDATRPQDRTLDHQHRLDDHCDHHHQQQHHHRHHSLHHMHQQDHNHHHHRLLRQAGDVASDVFDGHLHVTCPTDSHTLDVTGMEEECYALISMSRASGRDSSRSSPEPTLASTTNPKKRPRVTEYDDDDDNCCLAKVMKGEPLSPGSSSCAAEDAGFFLDDKSAISAISPHNIHVARFAAQQNTDSEYDDEELLNELELKVEAVDLPCEYETIEHKPTEESQELLPPTPPSTSCSDSESTVSASCSPERRDSHGSVHAIHHQNLRGCLQPRLYVTTGATAGQHSTTTRQPIHTPLISCQPKGSTGDLVLTEEEKKTLIAEGYPVPTKLPLTKHEEKSLKKVRRKIKNKISAQESRRKKKEYVDGLERRVAHLSKENANYQDRLSSLENSNRQLQKELQRFQAMFKIQSL